ncbi:MAG: flagellin [Nanoarchaeota archaeon]
MSLNINTNIASMLAQYNLSKNSRSLEKTTERLSSGLKINHASDDAAGLSISESLKTQIRGTQKANENAQDGINLLQIADGAYSVISDNLQRIRELTVQAANDTNSTIERNAIKLEVSTRIDDIQMIKNSTRFNQVILLDGSVSSFYLRIGPNSTVSTNALDISGALGNILANFLSVETTAAALSNAYSNHTNARNFLNNIENALDEIVTNRATLGALQNRLESVITTLQVSKENLTSTEGRIRSLDIADATAKFTTQQILREASVNVLGYANKMPTAAITLLNNSAI